MRPNFRNYSLILEHVNIKSLWSGALVVILVYSQIATRKRQAPPSASTVLSCRHGIKVLRGAAFAAVTTEQGWRKQPTQHRTVTRDCMCSNKKLLMMDTMVSETCRAAFTAVTTEQGWRKQPTQHHTLTRDCMCSNKKLLMMDTMVSETCREAWSEIKFYGFKN
jgi:hypothetical protein